ncbi:MAG TPA: dTDP-4-dehydrorhamnose reductase [Saprospiraceae bacterium]|nr:dTDP-4-dehydrorhamnose reductase [Saprospiraceae bacterium]HMP25194.1 dTDP-4-dehydrorhamnose reductase [Saprospiraceae bacterium]
MTSILVTGATGQIGQELRLLATRFPQLHFRFLEKKELDITDKVLIDNLFRLQRPDFCINCAAYTAVDKAESEPALAHAINVDGVSHLAAACARAGATLIHFSSDYVYHNTQNTPLRETDPTAPQSVYARTKLAGEAAALELCPATMIIRTSWVYAGFGHNFVKTMLRLGQERPELRVVYDQIGAPTYARDLAQALLDIIERATDDDATRARLSGIYNYSHEGVTSWYDFAMAIFEMTQLPCRVHPIEMNEYPTPAARPPYSLLHKGKIKAAFGLEIPHWRTGLQHCLQQMGYRGAG